MPLRVRGRKRAALDERLFIAFPSLLRKATARTFRMSARSRLRRALIARQTRLSYEAQNRGDLRLALCLYGPESELRNVPIAGGGEAVAVVQDQYRGREGAQALFADWTEPWDETRFEPQEVVDLGDGRLLVLSEMVTRGRVSGVEIREPLAQMITFRDGWIARQANWLGSWDEGLAAAGLSRG